MCCDGPKIGTVSALVTLDVALPKWKTASHFSWQRSRVPLSEGAEHGQDDELVSLEVVALEPETGLLSARSVGRNAAN